MMRNLFVLVFIGTHIIFVILQIHRHTSYTQYSYQKQKNEKIYASLLKEQELLSHELHVLYNNEVIKFYAQNNLGMMSINVHHIKRISL